MQGMFPSPLPQVFLVINGILLFQTFYHINHLHLSNVYVMWYLKVYEKNLLTILSMERITAGFLSLRIFCFNFQGGISQKLFAVSLCIIILPSETFLCFFVYKNVK